MERNHNFGIRDLLNWIEYKKLLISFILIAFITIGYMYSFYFVNQQNVNHLNDMCIFIIVGIFTCLIALIITFIKDKNLKTSKEIEEYIGTEIIEETYISKKDNRKSIIDNDVKKYKLNSIEKIKNNILYTNKGKYAQTMLITSLRSNEGKSWIINNLTLLFAKSNKKVLLIDANKKDENGLSDYILNITNSEKDLDIANKYINEAEFPGLYFMSLGSKKEEIAELILSENMKRVKEILYNMYDIVVFNGNPCLIEKESILISSLVDFTILVVEANKNRINEVRKVKTIIENIGGNLKGIILNKKFAKKLKYKKEKYDLLESGEETKSVSQENNNLTVKELIEVTKEKIKNNEIDEIQIKIKEKLYEQNTKEKFEKQDNEIENEKFEKVKNQIQKDDIKYFEISKIITKQNEYLKSLIEKVDKIQKEVRQESFKDKIKQNEKESQIELTFHIAKELKKLEEMQENNKIKLDEKIENINYIDEINNIKNQLKEMQEVYKELLPNVNKENTKDVESILESKIKEVQEKNEATQNINYTDEINNINNQLQKIQEMYEVTMQKTNTNNICKLEEIFNKKINEMQEESRHMLQKQIEQINYSEQIDNINKMLVNLKDSYLELSNIVRINNSKINYDDKIININTLKQNKRNINKKEYLYDEEILYEDLEKDPQYIIKLNKNFDEKKVFKRYI